MTKNRKSKLFFLILIFAFIAITFYLVRGKARDYFLRQEKQALPAPIESQQVVATENKKEESFEKKTEILLEPKEETLPSEFNLDIPFTSQAPHANWDATHEQTCEEAAILMTARYFKKQKIAGPGDAEEELQKLITWQKEKFGFFEDTTAKETARILQEYYGLKTQILEKPTVQQIKKEVSTNHPVVVPANGRELKNPFFKQPGPIYHMLVIKGYTKDKFITNDPGTKRGADFVYKYPILMAAIHDWTGQDASGPARVIVVSN